MMRLTSGPALIKGAGAAVDALRNGGKLEVAQQTDGQPRERPYHGLYDERNDQVSLDDEVERILI
jgi:hypothetical protein